MNQIWRKQAFHLYNASYGEKVVARRIVVSKDGLDQRENSRISLNHSRDDCKSYCGAFIVSFPACFHGSGKVLVEKIEKGLSRKWH